MANEQNKKRRHPKPRQEWNPHWSLKLLYTIFSVAVSLAKVAIGAAATVLLIVLICAAVFVGTLGDYLQEDILEEAGNWSIDDYDLERTSFIYYVDNSGSIQQLQQIYTATDRQWAPLEEIPEAMVNAAIAIEDKRFYEHQGVDWITTVKACLNMFFGGDEQFGGSTITQQLVKNLTEEKSVTVQRKVMEIFRAQMFERKYDKDLIMEYYLNEIYLGRGCYGVKSAAAEYFGKELQNLSVAECAALISITNNPSLFNPYSENVFEYEGVETDGAARNRSRQLKVLYQMLDQGYLTKEEYDEAVAQEMVFKSGIADEDLWTVCENDDCGYMGTRSNFTGEGDAYYCPICGSLTSVNTNASQYIYSWFVDAVIVDFAAYLAEKDGKNWEELSTDARDTYLSRIQKGGYHIYTTLDMDVQEQLDKIYQDVSNVPKSWSTEQQLQSAMVIIDNTTGDVVALSGGVGEKTDFLGYNRATQAKLQTGSAQKPISVYAPAFESGKVTPASVFHDLPVSYLDGNNWPKNDNRQYKYSRTVFQGIVSSVNTISVRTLDYIGHEYAYSFAKYNFGQDHLVERYETDWEVKSDVGQAPLALGALTVGATVREMSAAYATFANEGTWREPRLYTKIYNSDGELVVDNTQDNRKILSSKTVDYMNYCLYNAATRGTGSAAIFNGQTIAGKTGTTSNNRDRWFCGYTAHYTAAVWVGYDHPEQINISTANPAALLWRKVMQPIHSGLPNEGLYNGGAFRSVNICLDSGKLATAACYNDVRGINRVVAVNVYPGDEPDETCDKHVQVEYCVTGGGVANEYCHLYGDADITARSLVKLTQAEVNEIRAAEGFGLVEEYLRSNYVWLTDGYWYGFHGTSNRGLEAHYVICPVHDAISWDDNDWSDEENSDSGDDTNHGWFW